MGGVLSKGDLPEGLRLFVSDVRGWREFIEPMRARNAFNHRFGNSVTAEGYLRVVTEGCQHKIKRDEDMTVEERDAVLFDLGQPTYVAETYAYWDIPEKKIRIVLLHDSASWEVARHYGYNISFEQYLKKKEEDEKEEKIQLALLKESNENTKKEEKERLKKLLFA